MRAWLANAPVVRGCSTLRARADVFVALDLGNANEMVGAPCVVACANPSLRSSTATRHACGVGWVLRTGQESPVKVCIDSTGVPTRKPSPVKAVSSVHTGAGPIRACYNAGWANHRRHASHGSALQTHLRERTGERVHADRRRANQACLAALDLRPFFVTAVGQSRGEAAKPPPPRSKTARAAHHSTHPHLAERRRRRGRAGARCGRTRWRLPAGLGV